MLSNHALWGRELDQGLLEDLVQCSGSALTQSHLTANVNNDSGNVTYPGFWRARWCSPQQNPADTWKSDYKLIDTAIWVQPKGEDSAVSKPWVQPGCAASVWPESHLLYRLAVQSHNHSWRESRTISKEESPAFVWQSCSDPKGTHNRKWKLDRKSIATGNRMIPAQAQFQDIWL